MANTSLLVLDADAFVGPSSNAPERGVVQDRSYMRFDDSTQEITYSKAVPMPAAYAGTGTLKVRIQGAMASATGGNIQWTVAVEALTSADAVDTDNASSFDTTNNSGATAVPGTAGYVFDTIVTLTNKDSVAAGDMVRFKLARDPASANDTASGDLSFYCMEIYEES